MNILHIPLVTLHRAQQYKKLAINKAIANMTHNHLQHCKPLHKVLDWIRVFDRLCDTILYIHKVSTRLQYYHSSSEVRHLASEMAISCTDAYVEVSEEKFYVFAGLIQALDGQQSDELV